MLLNANEELETLLEASFTGPHTEKVLKIGMEQLFPALQGRLGFLGLSFTGGLGVLAMACEERIARAHFNVPTFGHHRLRLRQSTLGSGHRTKPLCFTVSETSASHCLKSVTILFLILIFLWHTGHSCIIAIKSLAFSLKLFHGQELGLFFSVTST